MLGDTSFTMQQESNIKTLLKTVFFCIKIIILLFLQSANLIFALTNCDASFHEC